MTIIVKKSLLVYIIYPRSQERLRDLGSIYGTIGPLVLEEELYYLYSKNKVLISYAFTAQLICAFVLAYAKIWFSYDVAHMSVKTSKLFASLINGYS